MGYDRSTRPSEPAEWADPPASADCPPAENLVVPDRRHRIGCVRSEHPDIGRRRLLEAGGLSLFGLGLADLLRIQAQRRHCQSARREGP